MNAYRPLQDPRRSGARILDTAEGVLIALRSCSLDQAFVDIVDTAKRHNVSPFSLADALVGIAQGQPASASDDRAVTTAREAWGHLIDARERSGRTARAQVSG